MQILLVDDDPLAGALAAAILEEDGHKIVLAENALEAMEQLNGNRNIGLIVCDMNMPLMDGLELFAELRAQNNQLPFILLTGDDPATLCRREPRLDDCLLKDADLEQTLPRAVRRAGAGQTPPGNRP